MHTYILMAYENYEKDQLIDCFSSYEKADKRKIKLNKQLKKYQLEMEKTDFEQSSYTHPGFYGELIITKHRVY